MDEEGRRTVVDKLIVDIDAVFEASAVVLLALGGLLAALEDTRERVAFLGTAAFFPGDEAVFKPV